MPGECDTVIASSHCSKEGAYVPTPSEWTHGLTKGVNAVFTRLQVA